MPRRYAPRPKSRIHDQELLNFVRVFKCVTRWQLSDALHIAPDVVHDIVSRLAGEDVLDSRPIGRIANWQGAAAPHFVTLHPGPKLPDSLCLQMADMVIQRTEEGWQATVIEGQPYLTKGHHKRPVLRYEREDVEEDRGKGLTGYSALMRAVFTRRKEAEYVDPDPEHAQQVAEEAARHGIVLHLARPWTERTNPRKRAKE